MIKVRKPGTHEIQINDETIGHFSNIGWKRMHMVFETRLDKIVHMSGGPILYIGATGPGKQTFVERYEELAYCHPVTCHLWALLQNAWKMDFGWKETAKPGHYANELKRTFVRQYGEMPMMTEREELSIKGGKASLRTR